MIDYINLTTGPTASNLYGTVYAVYSYYGVYGCIRNLAGRFGAGRYYLDSMYHYQPRLPMLF